MTVADLAGDGPPAGVAGRASSPVAERLTRRLEALPLRVRLVALVLLLLFVALALTGTATVVLMSRSLMGAIDSDLEAAAVPTAKQAADQLTRPPNDVLPTNYAVRFFVPRTGDSVEGPPSTAETETHKPDIPLLRLEDPRVADRKPFYVASTDGPERWRVIAGAANRGTVTYAVAVPLFNVDKSVRDLRRWVFLIGLTVMGVGAVLSWYGVRRAFRPLTEIEDTAAAIAAGDLTRRIPERTAKDEVTSLSASLNSMLAQIEHSFAVREASEERMRQFVGDASHELRTPLATVKGYAELFRQGAVQEPQDIAAAFRRIEDEASRMGGLVQDLLLLARLDDQRPMTFGPVDLTVLAADAVQDLRALDPGRPVALVGTTGVVAPTVVNGDESRLRQVLTNLVGNAVNHSPSGTAIEIAVGAGAPGRAELQVRDHGPGIDPAKARKVFERFYRADPSRVRGTGGGNGLGLAIVAAIVGAHRGKVGVAQTPGGGATFVVDLPAVQPASAD